MSDSILTRSIRVIDEVSRKPEGLRFSDIEDILGRPSPSTVSKILRELTQAEVLSKTREGRYVIGMKTYFWGKTVAARGGPIREIRGQMARLHRMFQASVNLFTCFEDHMFCLESIMSPQSPALWPAGKGLSLQLPVIGSIFFFRTEQLDDDAFLQAACDSHRPRLKLAEVREMIDRARLESMQVDRGLFYPGVCRLAVPLREQGSVTMVLGIGVLLARLEEDDSGDAIMAALREAKERIEEEMNS